MDNKEQQDRREARRKKRLRSQIMVYTVFLLVIVALGTGIGYGVYALMENRKASEEKEQDNQELIEEMLATEESLPSIEPTPDPTPEPTPEVVEPTREEKLDAYVDERIAQMPLEDKVAGLFVVRPETITGVGTAVQAGDGTRQALEDKPVGGLIYFDQNIQSEAQLKEMLANTAQYAKYPLFLAMDEEGGSVSRIGAAIGPKIDGAGAIGETGDP